MMNGLSGTQWLKVAGAIIVGISVGIVAAAFNTSSRASELARVAPSVPYNVPVSAIAPGNSSPNIEQPDVPGIPTDAEQIQRLKTRNRRLEALVSVLRQRATERQ